jgi:hypothetical protein
MGWIGGKRVALSDIAIAANTRNATVAVQSLDVRPINRSRKLMISLGARAVPKAGNQIPFYVEPVQGYVVIKAPKGLNLYKKATATGDMDGVAVAYANGKYTINLDKLSGAHWLFLR